MTDSILCGKEAVVPDWNPDSGTYFAHLPQGGAERMVKCVKYKGHFDAHSGLFEDRAVTWSDPSVVHVDP